MDIVNFWKEKAEQWNESNYCGSCWSFGAPLSEAAANVQQLTTDNQCCTHLFITDLSFGQILTKSTATGYVNSKSCDWSFTLYAVKPSMLGANNYNEVPGHPIDESLWMTTYKPLLDCLACDVVLGLCESTGLLVDITKWSGVKVYNWNDLNFNGWKIQGTFRISE